MLSFLPLPLKELVLSQSSKAFVCLVIIGGGGGNMEVNLVRISGPEYQNPPYSYIDVENRTYSYIDIIECDLHKHLLKDDSHFKTRKMIE